MDIKILAELLLLGQTASVIFIGLVISRQWSLRKTYIQENLQPIRSTLGLLSVVIFIGSLLPLLIDVLTLLDLVQRSTNHVNITGVIYAVSNTAISVFSSILIWLLYRMAGKVLVLVEHDKNIALEIKNNLSVEVQ